MWPTSKKNTYTKSEASSGLIPNQWDFIALVLVLTIIIVFGSSAKAMVGQFHIGETLNISLSPLALSYYALRSVLRMFIALACSLLFTFIFGTLSAKSRNAERIIIPMIDVLQSVPVLGFLSITVVGFIVLFQGSLLGPECAAIFVIFTAQVWNMTLSFYQSLCSLTQDLKEASEILQLSSWQRFWRVELPFAMPGLLWNTMLSMSGSWVFLVASEAISVSDANILLPGIGSYIATAIEHANKTAIIYVIIAMFIVIACYDQLLFRPLVAWSAKFKSDQSSSTETNSWVLHLFQRTHFFRHLGHYFSLFGDVVVNLSIFRNRSTQSDFRHVKRRRFTLYIFNTCLVLLIILAVSTLLQFIFSNVTFLESSKVLYFGFITALRVMILIVFSSLIWIPIGVWIGLHPRFSQWAQPIIQFLAAFPANLLFPIVVIFIVRYHLNVDIWISPLMILGAQWYILFNVIAGASALPQHLHHAVGILKVEGFLWWRRFILPGIFPYYITGVITAAGGAWNISIIAEAASWGHTHLHAIGLGYYITKVAMEGNFPRLALGISVMSLYVLSINRFIWRPLYNLAASRFQLR